MTKKQQKKARKKAEKRTKKEQKTSKKQPAIELMAPAGSYEALMAAIKAGADSVYFGVEQLNMRARAADNFTLKDLRKIASICKKNRIRSYLAVNTLLYEDDLK